MGVRRIDERSVEVSCAVCGMKSTMPTGTYRNRMNQSKSKRITCSKKCANTKPERE